MRRPLSLFAMTFGIALWGACSVDGDQCKVDGDCTRIFQASVDQLQCVRGVCGRRGPTFGADSGPPARACATTGDCIGPDGGASDPAFCRSSACVPILQGGIGEVSRSFATGTDPIFIGAIASVNVPTTEGNFELLYDKTNMDGIRLATADWEAQTQGGAISVAREQRPLSTVYCDAQASPSKLHSCFDAMTLVLKSPIVLVRSDVEATELIDKAIERDVVLYCTDCEPFNFRARSTAGHLWFGFASAASTHPMRRLWTKELESRIRSERSIAAGDPVKVFAVTSLANSNTSRVMIDSLELNGKSSADNRTAGTLVHRVVDRTAPSDFRSLAVEAIDFRADMILVENLGRDFHFHLMPEIEAGWPTGKLPPHYVTGSDEGYEFRFQRSVGGNDGLRRRVTGIGFNVNDPKIDENYFIYLDAFRSLRGYDANGISTGFEGYYVASYAVVSALHLATANPAALKGADVIEALKRLVAAPGSEIVNVRASEIPKGIERIASKARIDLRGVNSTLDWDAQTGELTMNSSTYCLKRAQNKYSLAELWVYDATTKAPIGSPDLSVCGF